MEHPGIAGLAGAGRSRIDPHHFPHMDRAGRGFSVRWLHAISAIQIALPILPTRTVSVIPSPMIGSGRERQHAIEHFVQERAEARRM
jgi:hypothetical protein